MSVQNTFISSSRIGSLEQSQQTQTVQSDELQSIEALKGTEVADSIRASTEQRAQESTSQSPIEISSGTSAINEASLKILSALEEGSTKDKVLADIDATLAKCMKKYELEFTDYEAIAPKLAKLKESDPAYANKVATETKLTNSAEVIGLLTGLKNTLGKSLDSLLATKTTEALKEKQEALQKTLDFLSTRTEASEAKKGIESLITQVANKIEQASRIEKFEATIENSSSKITEALSGNNKNIDIFDIVDQFISSEQAKNTGLNESEILQSLSLSLSPEHKNMLDTCLANRDKLPTEGLKTLYPLLLQMNNYENLNSTLLDKASLAIFEKALSPEANQADRQAAYDLLDNTFLSNPILSPILEAVKADFIQGDNPEQVSQLHDQHITRQSINQLLSCIDSKNLPNISSVKSEYVLELLKNLPTAKDGEPLDLLACDVFVQLSKFENPMLTDAQCIAKLPQDLQLKASAMLDTWKQLGITSSTQLDKSTQILMDAQVNRATLRLLLDTFNAASPEHKSQVAQNTAQALASQILNVNYTRDLDTQTILSLCAKKLNVDIAIDTDFAKAINTLAEESTLQGIPVHLLDQSKEILATLVEKQEAILGKSPLIGESFAYSILTLQQALVTDAKDLSDFDKAAIGLSDEMLSPENSTQFKQFAKDFIFKDSSQSFVKAVLAQTYMSKNGTFEPSEKAYIESLLTSFQYSNEQVHTLLEKLGIMRDNGLNLAAGVPTDPKKSDQAGLLMLSLVKNLVSASKNPIDMNSFTIDNASFTEPKDALIALLNAHSVSVTTKGKTISETFTNPIASSHVLTRSRATSLKGIDAKVGTAIVQNALKKVLVTTNQKDVQAVLNRLSTNMKAEHAQTASILPRLQNSKIELVNASTSKVFADANFTAKLVPLIMNTAFAQTNTDQSSFFLQTANHNPLNVLTSIVSQLEPDMPNDVAKVIAQAIVDKKDSMNMSADVFTSLSKLLNSFNNLIIELQVPDEAKNAISAMKIAQTAMQSLQELPKNTSLDLSAGISASISAEASIGIADLSAEVRIGATNGMTLWRDENNGVNLNISSALLGGASLGASFAGIANINLDGEVKSTDNLRLSFKDDQSCAEFVALFLTGQAKQDDLKLSSSIIKGSSFVVGGSIEASVGAEIEAPSGVCTVGAMASASIAGAISYHTEVAGDTRKTISEHSYDFNANLTAEASLQTPEHAALDLAKSIRSNEHASGETSAEAGINGLSARAEAQFSIDNGGFTASASANLHYNNNASEQSIIQTDLSGKHLKQAQKTISQHISCADTLGATKAFCAKLGLDEDSPIYSQLIEFLEQNPLSSFSITANKEIDQITIASLFNKSDAEQQRTINTAENYQLTGITISYSLEAMSATTDILGIVSLESSADKSREVTFV